MVNFHPAFPEYDLTEPLCITRYTLKGEYEHDRLMRKFYITIDAGLADMKKAVGGRDWSMANFITRDLWSYSGKLGAGRLHYICSNLRIALSNNEEDEKLDEWYQLLVECCIETKRWLGAFNAS